MILPSRYNLALARAAFRGIKRGRRALGRSDDVARVERGGLEWELDLREGLDLTIYVTGMFQRFVVGACRRWLRPGDVAIDVGANMGAHTLHLARAVGREGKVIAIEPTAYPFSRLLRNLALNPELAARTMAIQAFVVSDYARDIPETLQSSWPVDGFRPDQHPIHMGAGQTTEAAVKLKLDDLISKIGRDRIDLIKLDVDGAEWEVLSGANALLDRFHPTIVIEVAPFVLKEFGVDTREMLGSMVSRGYRFESLRGKKLDSRGFRWLSWIPNGFSRDVVAVHESRAVSKS